MTDPTASGDSDVARAAGEDLAGVEVTVQDAVGRGAVAATQKAATDSPEGPSAAPTPSDEARDVRIVDLDGRRLVLVGTAHISRSSVELVRRVIERERPDRVCIELDPRRFEALSKPTQWEELDLKEVIRRKQLTTLAMNLMLAAYQKKLGAELGVTPGAELLEAAQVAEQLDIPIALCDRDVRVTLRRAIAATPFFRRLLLLSETLVTLFESPEVSEEDLAELRDQDVLSEMMQELGRRHPSLKRVLIDERDEYLAERIRAADGESIVAVVGAGHLQGIVEALEARRKVDLEALDVVPKVSPAWKVVGWGVPVAIVGAIVAIGLQQGAAEATDNALFWILANSIPAGLGALIAWAHPLTILAAIVAAPITSLSPVIGTSYVTAFVQAWCAPPTVREFQRVGEDFARLGGWWSNRLLKIFLAYLLPGLGSMIGSVVGGYEILSNLF